MLIKADVVIPIPDIVLTPGMIRIDGRRIVEVGESLSAAGEKILDYRQNAGDALSVIIPGLIDGHCHLELSGLAGKIRLKDGEGLPHWLGKLLIRRPKWAFTQNRWVKRGIRQALAAGTTTVADVSANNRSWKKIVQSPIRAVTFAEVIGFGPKADRAMEKLTRRLKNMPKPSENFYPGLSPHAPYSTDEAVYRQCLEWTDRRSWRIMTHLAEDPAELEFLRTGGGPWKKILQILGLWDGRFKPPGTSPVGWAKSIGLLDRPSLLAHVNFADDQDIRTLSQGRASVVYCPLAHRYFRHPPHRYRDMLDAGVNVILGTDSLACAPTLSMFRQMQALHEAGGLGPERILAMATGNTSKSLRLEHLIGTIEKDKIADLIVLAIDRRYERRPVLGLVEPGGTVLAVLIDGNLVYV